MIGAVKVNIADQQFFLHFFMRSLIIISVNLWVILNINYSVHFVGEKMMDHREILVEGGLRGLGNSGERGN